MHVEIVAAAALLSAIALPHVLPLHAVTPATAAAVWLNAMVLRALAAVALAMAVFAFLPGTLVFEWVARWCWHETSPFATPQFGLSGHALADISVLLPGLALAAMGTWAVFSAARAGLAVRRDLRRHARGRGPLGSLVVHDPEVLVALTGVGRATVVVSDTALRKLDREELLAGLTHEWGHVRRRHRPLLLLGSLLAALARPLPGTRAAERGLVLSLERDADEYAVRATSNPLALASAICKAAGAVAPGPGLAALAGGTDVGLRLECLLSGGSSRATPRLERAMGALACGLFALGLGVAAWLLQWALTDPGAALAWVDVVSFDCLH